jgi:hypothetical protein
MPAGRPLTWDDPEAFSEAVEEYFKDNKTPTWSGLALHLGFSSRDSLNDYKKKDGFSDPIKKALMRIENGYEQRLFSQNVAGAIFALKNFGWKDKQEVESKSTIHDERIDESNLTDDELRVLAEIQRKSSVSKA